VDPKNLCIGVPVPVTAPDLLGGQGPPTKVGSRYAHVFRHMCHMCVRYERSHLFQYIHFDSSVWHSHSSEFCLNTWFKYETFGRNDGVKTPLESDDSTRVTINDSRRVSVIFTKSLNIWMTIPSLFAHKKWAFSLQWWLILAQILSFDCVS